jgi:hypothetical protein
MTTRSVEELRRQLRGRPEFREAIPSPIARVPARRTFQDFVPDYAQAAGASKLPSTAATVAPRPAVQNTVPDYVQSARMAAGRPPVRSTSGQMAGYGYVPPEDLTPRTRVRPSPPVPDYVQAARIADRRDPIHDLKPVDQFGIGVRSPSVPAGVDPHRYLGLRNDYYYPSGAELHGADELVPNPSVFGMQGQVTPQRVMRRRQQIPAGTRPSDFLGFRMDRMNQPGVNFPQEFVQNPAFSQIDPFALHQKIFGDIRPPTPRFSINAGGLPIPFHSALAAEPWPYGRFENLQRGGLAAPVPNRFRGLGFDEWYRQLNLPHSAYRSAVWAPMGPVGNTGVPWGV